MKKLLNRKDDNELFPLEVYKLVCSVASDANLINESIRWTEDWLNALDRTGDNANVALAVLCKVRLAVLELKSLRLVCVSGTVPGIERLEDLEAKVSVAIEGLGSVVRGRKHDLELLLQETGQLRRNSLGLLTAMPHDGPKVADTSTHVVDRSTKAIGKKVRCICDQAFKSVVQFCRKYMSMGISEEEHSQLQLILVPAIDTILSACLSGFDTECFESWENAESLLCECSAAVKVMERERPGYIDRFYERLSNVYYQIYLLYRKSPGSESKATRALRRSVSIMDQRPTSELVTASVSRKYQILGSSYLAARDYRRSEDAFLLAIKIAATTGSLNKFEEQATHSESVRQLVNSTDKEIVMIGAILTGLVKIASRKNDGVAAELRFDDIGLSVAIRGLLLEWTLSLALDQMDDDGSVMRTVGERLLDIYELEEMPIRRSRVIAKLLGLSVDRPNLLDPEAMRGLGEEVLEWANSISFSDLDEDTNLQAFKDDVVAHCSIGLGFSVWVHGTPQPELVWNAFRLWNGIIQHEGSWLGISNRIDNANKVIKRLEMAVEFFGMKGEADLRLAALGLLLEFRKLERPVNSNALITTYTRLGLQYLRLGYSGKAGMSIGKAQVWLKRSEDNITTATQLEWHLAYTEYLVGIGNLEKGLQCFYAANIIASQDEDLSSAKSSGAKIAERIRVNMIIADAAYVTSLIAFEKGNANESLLHARRCVRLNSRAWAGLENLGKDFSSTKSRITDTLSANMQALSLSGSKPREYSASHDALNLPKLWPLVSSLHLGYIQAANIYRHLGMIRESIYFMNHALKTVEAVDAKPSIDRTKVMLGDLKVRCGEMNEGSAMLENAGQSIGGGRAMVSFQIAVGNLERLNGNLEAEIEAYRRAEEALNSLVTNIMNKAEKSGNSELSNQIEQLSSSGTEKSPPRRPKTPTRRGGRAATALKSADAKLSSEKEVPPIESECTTLLKQKGDIQRLIARSMALQGECESATETLEQAAKLPAGNQEIISQGLVEAINHLQKAFSLVSSDPVFSSLQESTISLPSVTLSLELVRSSMASPVKKSIRKVTVKKTKAFIEVLEQARDCLLKVHSKAMRSGSSTTIPRVASLLTSIIVLLSAMTDLKGRGPEHPLFASYSLELQKGLATQREKLVVETEKHGAIAQETLQWPEIGASGVITATLDAAPFEFSSFRAEYIDIIPKEWAAVSVTMSENRKELYITRFQAEKSQLMVRLPLNRHNSRDDYLALIEYDAAMEELKEIIQRSNASTHQAKYMENKADRAQWWSERQELDDQMKALLEGIERAWLGGFKGIFSQYPKNPALFARFKASFDKVLSKLPSRKRKKAGKVDIDPRILELFIALGNPEGQDLDEALTDLIFFVVDILQFHGEGNAYDEIDIDTMVIAMTGALTAYHDEASFNPEEVKVEVDHIILILDKSVQMLPWESMPCLRGHSVSRLPSLAALRNRIVQMQGTITHPSRPGYYITRTSGGYILNPDSDLKNTQKMFENDLKALPGQWTGIVNRSPTEEEFKEILVNSDVLLYFGHGSGAHYIPARTIRKLDRCAVACLMGCSSGSLKDAGEFEPYGMPTNYLLAGCPAVLANLWDVTDKDIDKFTKEVFGKWGLLVTEPTDKKRAGKKHGNSLVEAVAAARDKCVMRYLNGAAPVVYGIPAYFG
ncbi:hypothetical protein K440DRAFT_584672 [Wilcoxina mikolae CBS 423.85]|nr:hypothetical protein K440DRAFT_584672 [Wilcoxina mikolae CBS 423.85]